MLQLPPKAAALLAFVLLAASAPAALAISADSTDPRAIMQAVEDRPTGDKSVGRMQMVIIDQGGSQRVRTVQTRMMEFPEGTKQLILFETPADVRNTGLLTVDYDDGAKVDDQWLYLPSLRKSTRISSSERSGAFMGSDFSFSDMASRSVADYDYTMVEQSAKVSGEDCWLIEARPRTDRAKEESGYVKSQVWVSKSKVMPVQSKHWVREGKKLKYMKFEEIRSVGGILVAHKISARTVSGKTALSTTVITFSDLRFGDSTVSDSDFTQRRLEQGL
ncbi:MAG: outer membrane lipoprotein-sorting protein [Myxococcota bacterium]